MDEERHHYQALLNYPQYSKYVLRRASNNFQVVGDQLHCSDHNSGGKTWKACFWRVPFDCRWVLV